MNNIEKISDRLLDKTIDCLVEIRKITSDVPISRLEEILCLEWRKRYPNTIAPCLYRRAKEKGGFPPCYKGPTETVNIYENDESRTLLEEIEEYQVHKRAMDRFAAMSDEEKFRTFVKAGIYTEEGELTERYGGSAPNPENGQ